MIVTSIGIVVGVIQVQYGGHGSQINVNGVPPIPYRLKSRKRRRALIPLQSS